jgi:2-oxoglutarate/2-oxoacid ferredoxin oxidoreductase subunit alpha
VARTSLSVVFAGSGGSGAMTAGAILLRAAAREGYYGLMTQLFGPQVRGGESVALVQISVNPVECQPDRYDLLVALDWQKLDQFATEIPLDKDSTIIADPATGPPSEAFTKSKARVVALTMSDPNTSKLEKALRGRQKNIFAAAAIATASGIPMGPLRQAFAEVFKGKPAETIHAGAAGIDPGAQAAAALDLDIRLALGRTAPRWLITGNEAVGMGALRGGIRFVGCYPITPATDLVEWLAPEIQELGGRLVLAEDELAAINMALGASFGGVPAMTVTSGPGLSLMVETIGLAVAAEVPVVLVDVMRAGPSTGIPSKTEQSDINVAIYGGHGDAPRVVLAPISVGDCLTTSEWAVYIAEALQSPVIVLSDQASGQSQAVIDPPTRVVKPRRRRINDVQSGSQFKRYGINPDPITPMPLPGTPGYQWVGEGLTHNEGGLPVSGAAAHVAQINKRAKKLDQFQAGELWGEKWGDGDTAIITFGSSVGPAREASRRLTASGKPTRVVGLRLLSPIPRKELTCALDRVRRVVVLEQNHGAQLYRYLLGNKAIPPNAESIARPGPLPFRPAELAAHLG